MMPIVCSWPSGQVAPDGNQPQNKASLPHLTTLATVPTEALSPRLQDMGQSQAHWEPCRDSLWAHPVSLHQGPTHHQSQQRPGPALGGGPQVREKVSSLSGAQVAERRMGGSPKGKDRWGLRVKINVE